MQAGIRVTTFGTLVGGATDVNNFLGKADNTGVITGSVDAPFAYEYAGQTSYAFELSFSYVETVPTISFTAGDDVSMMNALTLVNEPDCLAFDALVIRMDDNDSTRGIGLQNVVAAGVSLGNFRPPNGNPSNTGTQAGEYTIPNLPFNTEGYQVTGTFVRSGSDFAGEFVQRTTGMAFDIVYSCLSGSG
mmetsp:Transcript_1643/g.5271  ORF Transcript_1643/g.5271 Transcript_1643/m.5271 type:complete len:189 (-) Transcript_1643:10-576(-)